jgi:hypothetical protein
LLFEINKQSGTWKEARLVVLDGFVSEYFADTQRRALGKIRQDPHESIKSYTRRFNELVSEAYPNANSRDQQVMIETYIAGIDSERIVEKILEDGVPQSIKQVIDRAEAADRVGLLKTLVGRTPRREKLHGLQDNDRKADVEKLSAKLDEVLKTMQERPIIAPVAVGPQKQRSDVRSDFYCYNCGEKGHSQKNCLAPRKPYVPRVPPTRNLWTPEGSPICNSCKKSGHMHRECPERTGNQTKNA